MSNTKIPKGGAFLLEPSILETCFTPEDLNDEHRMIQKTTKDFVKNEIWSNHEFIENKDQKLISTILAQAGDLGLLSTDIPEEFGGMGLDKMSTCVVTEAMGGAGSFAVIHGAHTGIATLPIVYYGTKEQQKKYLPDLASGTKCGAYALTETNAGSDAVGGCRTKAVLSPDGKHWILNGEKMFITNGAWADTLIVFAKINNVDFSAFIVEKSFTGVSSGAEEKKMGIKGSSTTTIILEDAIVPVENLLYERGKGHIIALNVLNIGRYKLGASTIGASKDALKLAIDYAKNRIQFKQPIANFGAIREKLAKMATYIYIGESAIYRTVGLIDASLSGIDYSDPIYGEKTSSAIRQYAIECSINKILGSEVLDYTVDECVQIHGGYGYSAEYLAECCYRDARINRIFEGTNEVNRLLIPGEMFKRAMSGELPLLAISNELLNEIMDYTPSLIKLPDEPLALQTHIIEMSKKAIIFVAGLAAQKFLQNLKNEQEILLRIANMIIETFAMESGLLRAKKTISKLGSEKTSIYIKLVESYVDETIPKINTLAKEILAFVEDGDQLRTLLVGIRKLLKYQPINNINIRKNIAAKILDQGGYFSLR